MSFACLEWNHETYSPWHCRYTDSATKKWDVMKMSMRWALQSLVSIATEYVRFDSVAMNSLRIRALVLLIVRNPNSFMLTHMTRVQRGSQWKVTVEGLLCFFTFKLRVFHLFNCSSTSRRMREGGETDVHQTWRKRASTLYVTDTTSNFRLPLTFSVSFFFLVPFRLRLLKSVSRDLLPCLEMRGG